MVDAEDMDTRTGERQTAPQSPYTMRQVGIGALVTLLGVAVAYLVPTLLF